MNIAGLDVGSMSMRNKNLVEEEKAGAPDANMANQNPPLQH